MLLLAVLTMMACAIAFVGRSGSRLVPSPVTRTVTGVEPKKLYWSFKTKVPVDSFTLDCSYTPTGGTGAGNLNALMNEMRGYCNGQLKVAIRKNAWQAAAKSSFRLYEADTGPRTQANSDAEKAFVDANATVGTSTFPYSAYYTIKGPFQPGNWKFILDLDRVSNAWTGATGFTGDFSLNPRPYVMQPGQSIHDVRYIMLLASKKYTDTEIVIPPCHAYYLEAIANLDKIMHGTRNYLAGSTELVRLQYAWNQYVGKPWLGVFVTPGTPVVESDLGVYTSEGKVPIIARFTTNVSVAYAYMIEYVLTKPGKKKESAEIAEVPWPNETGEAVKDPNKTGFEEGSE